jgi:hypothetical protein
VDHDLIAAGHPRLTFEFAAYFRHMPAHWDAGKAPLDRQSPADLWTAGQLATAEAALKLLQVRAQHSAVRDESVWPELAEYDCYACHQDLMPAAPRPAPNRRPGALAWGSWNYSLLRVVFQAAGEAGLPESLAKLDAEMSRRLPDRQQSAQLAAEAAREIDVLQHRLALRPLPAVSLRSALREDVPSWERWDEWTQGYLAADALIEPAGEPRLLDVRRLLELPGDFSQRREELQQSIEGLLRP